MKLRLIAAAWLALVALWGSNSSAALVTYEGFDYLAGSLVGPTPMNPSAGINGGTGWAGNWLRDTEGPTWNLTGPVSSLAYPASAPFTSIGGRLDVEPSPSTLTGLRTASRDLATTYDMSVTGTEFYVSFLIRKNSHGTSVSSNASFEVNLRRNVDDDSDIRLGFGSSMAGNNWLVGGGTSGTGAANLAADTTYLMVYKISANTGAGGVDEIFGEAYAPNATVPLVEPDSWTRYATLDLGITIGEIRFRVGHSSAGGSFDEIRIGDSWASVVPEPSSVILICVGSALCFAVARRRRVS